MKFDFTVRAKRAVARIKNVSSVGDIPGDSR